MVGATAPVRSKGEILESGMLYEFNPSLSLLGGGRRVSSSVTEPITGALRLGSSRWAKVAGSEASVGTWQGGWVAGSCASAYVAAVVGTVLGGVLRQETDVSGVHGIVGEAVVGLVALVVLIVWPSFIPASSSVTNSDGRCRTRHRCVKALRCVFSRCSRYLSSCN